MNILTWLIQTLTALPPLVRVLMLAWVLEMISVPILKWIWGSRAERVGIVLGVILQAATVTAILVVSWGAARTLTAALIIALLGWLVEFIGSHTGIPFGRYHYTDRLQPQVGHVPLLIPLAWLMMLPPAWAVAHLVTNGQRGISFALVSGLAITAWDLFLDPQMVKWKFWEWEEQPRHSYFGIPWINFLGWTLSAGLMTAVISPPSPPTDALLFMYSLTWFLETFGQLFFWQLPGSAVTGFLGMGLLIMLSIIQIP